MGDAITTPYDTFLFILIVFGAPVVFVLVTVILPTLLVVYLLKRASRVTTRPELEPGSPQAQEFG